MTEKNMLIALVLSFFITGLGLIYDGLVSRGLLSFCISLAIGLLGLFVSSIFSLIGVIWALYSLYDTYQCTLAINENRQLPLFLTKFEIE